MFVSARCSLISVRVSLPVLSLRVLLGAENKIR